MFLSDLPLLPLSIDVETKRVLKKSTQAHRALAELKGIAAAMPNPNILIDSLVLREAKDSSSIENIITSHDELYKSHIELYGFHSLAAKEVQQYSQALMYGSERVREQDGISLRTIEQLQRMIIQNEAGFRKQPGTVLRNEATGAIIYTPPQHPADIQRLLFNLEQYLNEESMDSLDPLIRMAIIHHQFESIHPFYDGNGRTGRILNVLYLMKTKLLHAPILYLSRFIIQHKAEYYRLLQEVRLEHTWEEWILYMLTSVEETAQDSIARIHAIREVMQSSKQSIRDSFKFYSQDLINLLFRSPYTKIELAMDALKVSRVTAANYLNTLAENGILRKEIHGRTNYYVNDLLFEILARP
ncbi:MAG: Fic family protein [Saprospiraceae bacterium]|nr:Fic family protein [Saprospiraceae bacterium]